MLHRRRVSSLIVRAVTGEWTSGTMIRARSPQPGPHYHITTGEAHTVTGRSRCANLLREVGGGRWATM